MGWHSETVEKIKNKLKDNYSVRAPLNLPEQTREEALYMPDIVVLERDSGKIVCVIEVETERVRKAMCGAAILANTVLKKSKHYGKPIYDEKAKPILYFVVEEDIGEREREKLNRRFGLITKSLKNPQVKEIKLCTRKEFFDSEIGILLKV